jgi:integrase
MIKLRNGIYHCDFTVNGERVRQTLETTDKREAIQRERDLITQAKSGKLATGLTAELARLPFREAVDRYLEERSVSAESARPETVRQEGCYFFSKPTSTEAPCVSMGEFFGAKHLNRITADDIRQFQAMRLAAGYHPNGINHAVKALLRLLKRAKLASRIRDDVQLLKVRREPREMLTPAEKERLFHTAAQKPEWEIAFCAAVLTANTSMRPVEIRRLRWADVDPFTRLLIVRRSKTDAGARVIPLNDDAWGAVRFMKKRSEKLRMDDPEHYVFPGMRPRLDATKPMGKSGWRSAWRTLRAAVQCPKCGKFQQPSNTCRAKSCKADMRGLKSPFARLRFYDLRQHAGSRIMPTPAVYPSPSSRRVRKSADCP